MTPGAVALMCLGFRKHTPCSQRRALDPTPEAARSEQSDPEFGREVGLARACAKSPSSPSKATRRPKSSRCRPARPVHRSSRQAANGRRKRPRLSNAWPVNAASQRRAGHELGLGSVGAGARSLRRGSAVRGAAAPCWQRGAQAATMEITATGPGRVPGSEAWTAAARQVFRSSVKGKWTQPFSKATAGVEPWARGSRRELRSLLTMRGRGGAAENRSFLRGVCDAGGLVRRTAGRAGGSG